MSNQIRHRALALSIAASMLLVVIASMVPIDDQVDAEPSRALPSRINLSNQVPYHGRAGEDLSGEASLSMIFDYHGPYIMQQDIRNVTKGLAGSGVANVPELVKAAHHSKLVPQSLRGYGERSLGYGAFYYDWNENDDRVDRRFGDLYAALADGHPIMVYMYLNTPPELNPDPQPPDPNNPQPPDPKVTLEDLAALEKVWRLVVGYDTNQGNGIFILHDPLPGGIGFLGGKSRTITRENFDTLWNIQELGDQRISSHRYGMTAAPWVLKDLNKPKNVDAGTGFEISVNVTYDAPPVLIGSSVSSPAVVLDIPDEYSFKSGSGKKTLELALPRSYHEVSWTVIAPERGYTGQDWKFHLNATGNVTVGNPERHFDRLGVTTSFEVRTMGYVNHPPVIEDSIVDPERIPDDGSVSAVVSARVSDEDGNIRTVEIDLSPINGNEFQVMYDDGRNGDQTSGDGIYSYRISKMIDKGEYILKITAKDSLGGRAYDNVTLTVEDAAAFTNAPEIVDKGVTPSKIPNDGFTTSVIWAMVEDEEDDIGMVYADLSEVGGEDQVRMFDDGTSGDLFSSDGNYSVEFTVSPLVEISIYQVRITATDLAGHETSAKVWVDVVIPPVAPVVVDTIVDPEEVPNDGETVVVLSVIVEDDNDDVETVWADLTPLKRSDRYLLNDNGVSPDQVAGDNIWTTEFTVPGSVSEGQKGKIDVYAEDSVGLQGSSFFSLTITKTNTPPELVKYNVTNGEGRPMTEFSIGETVIVTVEAFDQDINDILTVSLDLSELGMSEMDLLDDDDGRFTGEFTIPENRSGKYNLTVTVKDNNGATDSMVIRITVKEDNATGDGVGIDSMYIVLGVTASFLILLVLAVMVVIRRSRPSKPMMRQRAMPPSYGARPMR